MELEDQIRKIKNSEQGPSLEKLARSAEGKRLASKINGVKLEAAAREGDMKALSAMLRDILSTPEGQRFAAAVERTVRKDGQ